MNCNEKDCSENDLIYTDPYTVLPYDQLNAPRKKA